jgi:hypothetical protein
MHKSEVVMKRAVRKSIEIGLLGVMFLLTSLSILAQPTVIEPGNKSVDPALVNIGKFTWASRFEKTEERLINMQRNGQEITVETRETKKGIEKNKRTFVLNARTFEMIRQSYTDENKSYNLQYGSRVKGVRPDFDTNKKENIDAAVTGKFYDPLSLPYLISTLPLSLDYRVTFPVMRLNNAWQPEYVRYRIVNIVEYERSSCLLGTRNVWKVSVYEKTQDHSLHVYVDKQTRRIVGADEALGGVVSILIDKETDINPIKAPLDAEGTKAMITNGTSSIKGQASTKISEKRMLGNKTQFAPKGSLVTLIPNTPYYKEWMDLNLKLYKIDSPTYANGKLVKGCAYPMPPELKEATLVTEVIDDKGNFVFQNLKPGEYLVWVGFLANKYTRTTRTPNGNYTVTLNNDGSASATQDIDVTNFMSLQNVVNFQFVTVKKDGETVNVKLKD